MSRSRVRGVAMLQCMLMLSLVSIRTHAAESDISYEGTLVAEPCTIAAGPDGGNIEVEFGTIPDKLFYMHKRTWTEPFHILLQDCDLTLGTKVTVTFVGSEEPEQPGLLAITDTTKNVAIGFLTADGSELPLNKPTTEFKLNKGTTELKFGAYLQANDSAIRNHTVGLGEFEASTTFKLDYL